MVKITLLQPGRGHTTMRFIMFLSLAHLRVAADKFCGFDEDDAKSTCWQPCRTDNDCCDTSLQRCFETGSDCGSSDLGGTNHFFCGTSWCEAAYTCGTACADPEFDECPDGQSCFADLPCDSAAPRSVPPPPVPPTSSPYQFCGSSMADAKDHCWQPCPRGESDCCRGLGCYDTSAEADQGDTCSSNDYSGASHFYCGSSWCDAAYECNAACPDGSNDECPSGQYCYADVPCSGSGSVPGPPDAEVPPNSFSQFCGTSELNAAENCWQPCRDDDDCCFDQTCYSEVTACEYAENIGADHFFCGADFCDASFNCPQPCSSGYDAECPAGQRCIPNTPCNANVRTITTRTLDYGLPRDAMNLIRTYQPGQTQSTANAEAQSTSSSKLWVGLLFGLCLFGIVLASVLMSKRR